MEPTSSRVVLFTSMAPLVGHHFSVVFATPFNTYITLVTFPEACLALRFGHMHGSVLCFFVLLLAYDVHILDLKI